MMDRLNRHPNLTTWAVLAVGMLAALAWSARDEGLAPSQWAWLAVAVAGVAGLCAWIISWEADIEDEEDWLGRPTPVDDRADDATGASGRPAAATEPSGVTAPEEPASPAGGSG